MTEKIRRVAVDGPPDPDEHPWVAAHNPNFSEHFVVQPNDAAAADWSDSAEWYPVPAPPTEYMTVDDEGVEVDGSVWRLSDYGLFVERYKHSGELRGHVPTGTVTMHARVAQALGLVDQPSVEWVTDRLPNDDELPAVYVWIDPPGMFDDYGVWTVPEDYKIEEPCPELRWRSLLDAAGLGERGEAT